MSKLKELNPHKNEVVRIKFKSITQIIKDRKMDLHDAEEFYDIGSNIKAYISGGDFIITESITEEYDKVNITVKNHYDNNHVFYVYDDVIESISIIQDAERFYSGDLNLLVIRIEDEMYINGQPLIWDEDASKAEHERRMLKKDVDRPYINENRKLLKIFENFIADLAVKESFKQMGE